MEINTIGAHSFVKKKVMGEWAYRDYGRHGVSKKDKVKDAHKEQQSISLNAIT